METKNHSLQFHYWHQTDLVWEYYTSTSDKYATAFGFTEEVIYVLALTNHEVLRMFYSMVRGWFGRTASYYNDFVKALLVAIKRV